MTEQPLDWFKGYAATSRTFYDLAVDFRIVSAVRDALGDDDVLLWGASLAIRQPGETHAWHCDVESWSPDSRSVPVWVGLRNTTPATGLVVQPGSHRFGSPVHELTARNGVERHLVDDETIWSWARQMTDKDDIAGPETLNMNDGDVVLFDGRLWHRSASMRTTEPRVAVLLQYTAAASPVRMPDLRDPTWTWPFEYAAHPHVPCVRVSGNAASNIASSNRIVAPPPNHGAADGQHLRSSAATLSLPIVQDDYQGWASVAGFRGFTDHLADLSCHVSALSQGACPHHPHQHPEEEILLILSGQAELTLPDLDADGRTQVLGPGEFVYYPAGFWHTLTGVSHEPVHYLMIKWLGERTHAGPPLPHVRHSVFDSPATSLGEVDGFKPALLFEQPTDILDLLHSHVSVLEPGAGYAAHDDDYDVVMVLLEGQLETLGQQVSPIGIAFYAAGEDHGLHNPGSTDARYLVFELHGSWGARHRLDGLRPSDRTTSIAPLETAPELDGGDRRPGRAIRHRLRGGIDRVTGAVSRARGLPYKAQVAAHHSELNHELLREIGAQLDRIPSNRPDGERIVQLEAEVRHLRNTMTVRLAELSDQVRSVEVATAAIAEQEAWSGRPPAVEAPPLVSVICPLRNRSHTMDAALASIRAQTHVQWECVIVDDGSDDLDDDHVRRWQRDPRIRVIRQEHHGVSAARNRGLAESTGEIVAYLDSDNTWHPTYLERVVHVLTADPGTHWTFASQLIVDADGAPAVRPDRSPSSLLASTNFIDLNVVAHRRSLLSEVDGPPGFDEVYDRLGDWELFQRFVTVAGPPARIAAIGGTYRTDRRDRISRRTPLHPHLATLRARGRGTPADGLRVLLAQRSTDHIAGVAASADVAGLRALGATVREWSPGGACTPAPARSPVDGSSLADAIAAANAHIVLTHSAADAAAWADDVHAEGSVLAVRASDDEADLVPRLCRRPGVIVHLPEDLVTQAVHPLVHSVPASFDQDRFPPARGKDRSVVARISDSDDEDHDLFLSTAIACPQHRFVLGIAPGTDTDSATLIARVEERRRSLRSPAEVVVVDAEEATALVRRAGIYLHTGGGGQRYWIAAALGTGCYVIAADVSGMSGMLRGAGDVFGSSVDPGVLVRRTSGWSDHRWEDVWHAAADHAHQQFGAADVAHSMLQQWHAVLGRDESTA